MAAFTSNISQKKETVDYDFMGEKSSTETEEEKVTEHVSSVSTPQEVVEIDKGDRSLSTFSQHYVSIECVYQSFLATGDISNLGYSISKLENMEKIYEDIYAVNKEEAGKIKGELDTAHAMVQKMNNNSQVLTRQDVRGINSFFKKPVEENYTDKDGTVYIQPDHSGLLRFGGDFFISGEYESIGLLRHYKINGSLCDVLYLKKQKDQIEFESQHKQYVKELKRYIFEGDCLEPFIQEKEQTFSFCFFTKKRSDKYISELLKTQFSKIKLASQVLIEKCQAWKYKKLDLCEEKELKLLGISEEASAGIHAILFYFKKSV